jgi:thioredoxin-like negative regulator of GroEL
MNFLDVNDEKSLQELIKHYQDGTNIFVLIYMNGCGPCEETKPEWIRLKNKKWGNTIICQINQDVLPKSGIFNINDITGFPTIRHYLNNSKTHDYQGERTAVAFENWINSIVGESDKTKPKSIHIGHFKKRHRTKKTHNRRSRGLKSKRRSR